MGLLQNTNTPTPAAPASITPLFNKDLGQKEEFPVPIYQFAIQIDGEMVAFFQSVTGMTVKRQIDELTEGGRNDYTLEFPGHVAYDHITFEVGMTSSSFFFDWMMDGQFDGRAQSKNFTLLQLRPNPDYKDGDDIFIVTKRWNFDGAFPVSWKISDLSIDDSQKIVVESLELSFNFFTLG